MKDNELARELERAIQISDYKQIVKISSILEKRKSQHIAMNVIKKNRQKKPENPKKMKTKFWPASQCYEKAKELKLKHLYKIRGKLFDIEQDPIRSVNYTLMYRLFEKHGKKKKLEQYAVYERMHDFKSLKSLATYMKNNGPDGDSDWYLFTDIDTMWGYKEVEHGDAIVRKIEDWVVKKFRPEVDGSEEVFNDKFRVEIAKLLRWKDTTQEQEFTVEEFCKMVPLMGTTGSAYDPEHRGEFKVDYDGKKLKMGKNKYTKAFSMSVAEKVEMIKTSTTHNTNVSIKQELYPKVRTIVSLEFSLAEQQRYVDTWLRKWMDNNPLSTLWSNAEQKLEMWEGMIKLGGVNVPIDQSAFDTHVSKTMIKIINEEILLLLKERCKGEDLIGVMEKICIAMEKGNVHYQIPEGRDITLTTKMEY